MKTRVLIVGAGPYGVSIACELHRRGVPFVIAGEPFSLWFDNTLDNMAIRSDWHSSEIFTHDRVYDVRAFLQRHRPDDWQQLLGDRLPVGVFRDYLRDVLARLPFAIRPELVQKVQREGEGFVSTLATGEQVQSEVVVVATGIGRHRYLPPVLQQLDPEQVAHGWHVRDYSDWQDRRLLVVGAGQSAGEAVALLKQRNKVSWLLRHDPVFYSEPLDLPVPVFNAVLKISPWFYFMPRSFKKVFGRKFVIPTITPDLQDQLVADDVEILRGDLERLGLRMEGGHIHASELQRDFDGIVAATGYHYHVDNLGFLDPALRAELRHDEGTPRLDYDFATSVSGLYMVGGMAEPAYGPAQRFMMGAAHASARLGRVLSAS